MTLASDLNAFLADFGVAATLNGVPVRGILDRTPQTAFGVVGGPGLGFQLPTTSVPAEPRALALVVGAETFTVRDFEHDGTGVSTLQLEAA